MLNFVLSFYYVVAEKFLGDGRDVEVIMYFIYESRVPHFIECLLCLMKLMQSFFLVCGVCPKNIVM